MEVLRTNRCSASDLHDVMLSKTGGIRKLGIGLQVQVHGAVKLGDGRARDFFISFVS